MLSEKEKKILGYISEQGVGISKRPFLIIADALDMTEGDVTQTLTRLKRKGIIKNLRAVINHRKAGYKENALIAWRMRPEAAGAVKGLFIKNNLISHCYEREPQRGFNYNIFTMMHARAKGEIEVFAEEVAKKFGIDYVLLFTEGELKKEKLDLKELLCSRS